MGDGSKANRTGKRLENFVHNTIKSLGYSEDENLNFSSSSVNGKKYAGQVEVGKTIYGTKRIVDFIVFNSDQKEFWGSDRLIIECK